MTQDIFLHNFITQEIKPDEEWEDDSSEQDREDFIEDWNTHEENWVNSFGGEV